MPLNDFLEDLLKRGELAIQQMCDEGREETLHLEFKTLQDHTAGQLTKDDRKLIAKALGGLANAEGGLLILGVETRRVDNLDCAHQPRPIHRLSSFRNRLQSWLPEALSPEHTALGLEAVQAVSEEDVGYIAISVSPSDRRPHMSMAQGQQRYYRRGSQGTIVMLHSEVRDLMLAQQSARLQALIVARSGGSRSGQWFDYQIVLYLRNVGSVPARGPYATSQGRCHFSWGSSIPPGFRQDRNAEGFFGVYADGLLVHLEDTVEIGHSPVLRFHARPPTDHRDFMPRALSERDDGLFDIGMGGTAVDLLAINGFFGAENSPRRSFSTQLDKFQLLELALSKKFIIVG